MGPTPKDRSEIVETSMLTTVVHMSFLWSEIRLSSMCTDYMTNTYITNDCRPLTEVKSRALTLGWTDFINYTNVTNGCSAQLSAIGSKILVQINPLTVSLMNTVYIGESQSVELNLNCVLVWLLRRYLQLQHRSGFYARFVNSGGVID